MISLRDERWRDSRHQHSEGTAMKFHRRRFLHLVGLAAAVAVFSVTVTGHGAWSQTAILTRTSPPRPAKAALEDTHIALANAWIAMERREEAVTVLEAAVSARQTQLEIADRTVRDGLASLDQRLGCAHRHMGVWD
jgi:predicted membrane-bound mannosyltransferase